MWVKESGLIERAVGLVVVKESAPQCADIYGKVA